MKNTSTTKIALDPQLFRAAAGSGNINLMREQIEAGVNINDRSPQTGITALIETVIANRIEAFKFLLQFKPNVQLGDNCGFTAMHYAGSVQNVEFIEILVAAGANINAMSDNDVGFACTPLMQAAKYIFNDAVKKFIELGADLTVISPNGKSALDVAIKSPNIIGAHIIRTAIADQELRKSIKDSNPNGFAEELPAPSRRGPGIF